MPARSPLVALLAVPGRWISRNRNGGSARPKEFASNVNAVLRRARRIRGRLRRPRRARHHGPVRDPGAGHPGRPHRSRRAGAVADGLRQDAGVRRAARRAADGRRARTRGARARAHSRARAPRSRRSSRAPAKARGLTVCAVYGGAPLPSQAKRAQKSHDPRGHPRPPVGSDRAAACQGRQRADTRPGRGRPHARHGLPASGRPDRAPDPGPRRRSSSRRRSTARSAGSRAPTPPTPVATRPSFSPAPARSTSATRSWRSRARRSSTRWSSCSRPSRAGARLRPHKAWGRPAREAPLHPRHERGGDARRPSPAHARARAAPVRGR